MQQREHGLVHRVPDPVDIAIMAGLNVAHELLSQGGGGQTEEARARLARCNALLDSVLEDQDKLF